jgi:hypothetical protein
MSRTALDGFPLKDIEKDFMLDLIKRFSALYFTEILGFCLMGNHFHLLVKMIPEGDFSDYEIKIRFIAFYGDSRDFAEDSWRAAQTWNRDFRANGIHPDASSEAQATVPNMTNILEKPKVSLFTVWLPEASLFQLIQGIAVTWLIPKFIDKKVILKASDKQKAQPALRKVL